MRLAAILLFCATSLLAVKPPPLWLLIWPGAHCTLCPNHRGVFGRSRWGSAAASGGEVVVPARSCGRPCPACTASGRRWCAVRCRSCCARHPALAAHQFRQRKHRPVENTVLLKLDLRNAFSSVSRQVVLREVRSRFPELACWADWTYGQSSRLRFGPHVVHSTCGV